MSFRIILLNRKNPLDESNGRLWMLIKGVPDVLRVFHSSTSTLDSNSKAVRFTVAHQSGLIIPTPAQMEFWRSRVTQLLCASGLLLWAHLNSRRLSSRRCYTTSSASSHLLGLLYSKQVLIAPPSIYVTSWRYTEVFRSELVDEDRTAWHIRVLEEFIFCILIFAY